MVNELGFSQELRNFQSALNQNLNTDVAVALNSTNS